MVSAISTSPLRTLSSMASGVYHRVYHKGFEAEIPYVVAVVQLDEGPRLVRKELDESGFIRKLYE